MSEESEIREDDRRKVTPVGNSWIVCKSRSHKGHVYYFNTLTGEAAWNLSATEIEKAKTRTKTLESQSGGKQTSCPEPKDLPPSIQDLPTIINNAYPAHRPFIEPFVNSTVSEQQSTVLAIPNMTIGQAPFSSPQKLTSSIMQHTLINNNSATVETIQKLNSLNNIINTFNLNAPATSAFNPHVWAVPQTQQIFISPNMTPLLHQTQASMNIAYNNLSPTVSQPTSGIFSNSFENATHSENMARGTRKFYPRNYNNTQGAQQNLNKKFAFTNKRDLRQKILNKKRFMNAPFGSFRGSGNSSLNFKKSDINNHKEESHSNNKMQSLNSMCLDSQHETPSRLDLGPLKSLAPSDSNLDAWFIIVDLELLLNEFKFLNTLTDSDEQCHLMVPKCVMSVLKDYVTCTESVQARRILRFLSQQIEMGFAFMAEDPSVVKKDSMAETIVDTCIKLRRNNYHVILLSNDNELLKYKDSCAINIFSVHEVKNLIKVNPHFVSNPKKQLIMDELIHKIKIVVPNTSTSSDSPSVVRESRVDDHIDHISITEPKTKESSTQGETDNSTVLKRTVDAGIQTDFENINATITIPIAPEKISKKDTNSNSNNYQNSLDEIISHTSSAALGVPEKKRELKLNRSISNQPVTSKENSEKKQFKWRRRRNTTPQDDDQNKFSKTECPSTLKLNRGTHEHEKNVLHNNYCAPGQHENKAPDDSICSTESSFVTDLRNSKNNVTIEETSTSGIISNSGSNIDEESNYCFNNSTVNQQHVGEQYNKPMYEIDSITMEEYLTMKCDEWVSRFIQIMEEVLSQLLQQDPSFSHKSMPPPWTLHEATQCIAIKFSNFEEIKNAANLLSNVLFHISDAKGKITMNLLPRQYMEMYSFGVHLLAAIKMVVNSCEDIQIAEDSLNKLLEDIKNPNLDANDCTNDNFNDTMPDVDVTVNEVSDVCNLDDHDDTTLHKKETRNSNKSNESNKNVADGTVNSVKFIRKIDIKSSFFSSLKLQSANKSALQENASVEPQELHKEQHSDSWKENTHKQQNSQNSSNQQDISNIVPTNHQNVIRNFSICAEFEDKLKKKYEPSGYENYNDILDYEEEDYGEYLTEWNNDNDSIEHNEANYSKTNVVLERKEMGEPSKSQKAVDPVLNDDDSNKKFKYMMFMLLQEMRKALCQIKVLCDKCYEELENPDPSSVQKCELNEMAKRAHKHIISLCRSLQRMLDHEDHPDHNMRSLLKQADINMSHVDESLLAAYRITVAKWKDHADAFLNSIQSILSAFNN